MLYAVAALLVGGSCTEGSPGGTSNGCTRGEERCECFGNETCFDGLTCLSGFCVDAAGGGNGASSGNAGGADGGGAAGDSSGGDGAGEGGNSSGAGGDDTGGGDGGTSSRGGDAAGGDGAGGASGGANGGTDAGGEGGSGGSAEGSGGSSAGAGGTGGTAGQGSGGASGAGGSGGSDGNLVSNGAFDDGLTDWVANPDIGDITADGSNERACFSTTDGGQFTLAWPTSSANSFTIRPGVTYRLTYRAVSTDSIDIRVQIRVPVEPYTTSYVEFAELDDAWASYETTFNLDSGSSNLGLAFIGTMVGEGTTCFDDVLLVAVE